MGNRTAVTEVLASPGSQTPFGWGLNTSGQLGGSSTGSCTLACSAVPEAVTGSVGTGTLNGVIAISAGISHSVALKSDGTVWSWGGNTYGELGNNSTTASTNPVQASGLSNVIAVTAGYSFTLALKSDGTVWSWGLNNVGQLGTNNAGTDSHVPVQVKGVGGTGNLTGVSAISAGAVFGLALKSDGSTIWAWGSNSHGQLGNNSATTVFAAPVTVSLSGSPKITAIAAGGQHSLALKSDKTVLAWGWDSKGQLGIIDPTHADTLTPVSVVSSSGTGTLTGVDSIGAGYQHSLATIAGTVWSWGYNCCGQLGIGSTTDADYATQVNGLGGTGKLTNIVNVSGGQGHTVAVGGGGGVWSWGQNSSGQLGDGSTTARLNPTYVTSLGGNTAIAAGAFHSAAMTTTRTTSLTYSYDHLYRLTNGGTPGSPTSYTDDPVGNRLSQTIGQTTTSSTYDRADQISLVGSTTYAVNANGNLTAVGSGATYAYDQVNRLTTAVITTTGTITSTYTYDGDGKRATRKVGAGTTIAYVYDINSSLPNVLGDGTTRFVYGLGLAYTVDGSNNVQTLHTDGQGSVRAMTDSSGNVIQTFQTDEFGNPTLVQGTSTQPFRYTGEQNDSETGFYDLRARYYAPGIGRFVSRDMQQGSTTEPGSLNHYVYTENRPMTFTDPSGHCVGPLLVICVAFLEDVGISYGTVAVVGASVTIAVGVNRILADSYVEQAIEDWGNQFYADYLSPRTKKRLAKKLADIPRSASPIAQGYTRGGGRWWEYDTGTVDKKGNPKRILITQHPDDSVHVGTPKSDSTHLEGGFPRYHDNLGPDGGGYGHVGEGPSGN